LALHSFLIFGLQVGAWPDCWVSAELIRAHLSKAVA